MNDTIINISIENLVPHPNNPFKLYSGERLDDMVRSIEELGVLEPVIVHPLEDGKYGILSGHNRVNAAKIANLSEVPAVIKTDLADDEAKLIVTESNLVQRSFADLSYSERAFSLKAHMDAIKQQGKRKDLIDEIERLLDTTGKNSTSGQFDPKLEARDKTAQKYGLSASNVSRYIRLCKLIPALLDRLDNEQFGFIPAVIVSDLSHDSQDKIEKYLVTAEKLGLNWKLNVKNAENLRYFESKGTLDTSMINSILSELISLKPEEKPVNIKIERDVYSKYFNKDNAEDAPRIISEALEMYFRSKE